MWNGVELLSLLPTNLFDTNFIQLHNGSIQLDQTKQKKKTDENKREKKSGKKKDCWTCVLCVCVYSLFGARVRMKQMHKNWWYDWRLSEKRQSDDDNKLLQQPLPQLTMTKTEWH